MMMHIQNQEQHFVYVDSSEEEDTGIGPGGLLQEFSHSDLSYRDSSSDTQNQNHFGIENGAHCHGKGRKTGPNRLCKVNSDDFLLKDNYMHKVEKIIRQNQQRLSKKTPLLVTDTDKQILQNLQKRKKNYGFFLRTLETDKQYSQILSAKVQKLKDQNERKKQVLTNKRLKQTAKQDQDEMKKYVLGKKTKEEIVIDKIQKHAYKLGIERIRAQEKQAKSQIKHIDEANFLKTTNLDIKQRNQIYELRQQLEQIKQVNKVNKLDQKKVLKDLQQDISHTKKALVSKAETAQLNKFII